MPETLAKKRVGDIPGWFSPVDMQLFEFFLRDAAPSEPRDLVELGAYLGKSAAHMGAFLRPGERFYVCDLFDPTFKGLTREQFEQNYRAVRGDLPVIVQGLSSQVTEHVRPSSARFVHVDASHAYEDVCGDIEIAKTVLADDGVVVLDDYRTQHAPGVAAAVWSAVARGELTPICLSPQKFYGAFGAASSAHLQRALRDWRSGSTLRVDTHSVAGHEILRFTPAGQRPANRATSTAAAPQEVLDRFDKRLARVERLVRKIDRQNQRRDPMTVARQLLSRRRRTD